MVGEMTTLDKNKARQAARQLIEANRESRPAIIHARKSVSKHIVYLKSARPYYQANELNFRKIAHTVAEIVELSNDVKNRQIFDQLNEVYGEELQAEEKDFLEQTKRYWRDRFADSE